MRRRFRNVVAIAVPWLAAQAAGCSLFADLDFPGPGGASPPGSVPEGGAPGDGLPDGTLPDGALPDGEIPVDGPSQGSRDAGPSSDAAGGTDAKVPVPVYADVVLADHPVGYWRVGEASGTEAKDLGSGAHKGTYGGGFALGAAGAVPNDTAVHLDGQTGSRVVIGDFFDFGNNAPYTLEAWAKSEGGLGYVIAKRFLDGTGYALFASGLTGGSVLWIFSRTNGDLSDSVKYTSEPSAGFVHIVATYDGSKGILYFNGSEVDRASFTQRPFGTAAQLSLGASSGGDGAFKGTLDELAIYDRALPPDRIKAHFLAAAR